MSTFKVSQIDHVELFVPDIDMAAEWYATVLGLEPVADHQDWAKEDGPLMISSDQGKTMVALFAGEPQGRRKVVGWRRTAFRVDGQMFIRFLDHLENVEVLDPVGQRVSDSDVVDHGKAFSIYFADPYQNRLEVTTYEYDVVREKLAAREVHPLKESLS